MATDHRIDLIEHIVDLLKATGYQSTLEIELLHAPPRQRPDLLKGWSRDSHPDHFNTDTETSISVNAERLSGEILKIAERYADSFGGGAHTFVVRSSHQLSERRVHRFTMYPSTDAGAGEAMTPYGAGGLENIDMNAPLSPTERGVVGMLMRHIDNRDKAQAHRDQQFLGAIMHQANALREENNALRATVEKRDLERREYIQMIEDARSRDHERQIEALTVTSREERKTIATKKIVGLFPVAINGAIRAANKFAEAKANAAGANGSGANGGKTNGASSHGTGAAGAGNGASSAPGTNGTPAAGAPSTAAAQQTPLARAVSEILGSLQQDQERLSALQGILSFEQQASLSEIFETTHDEPQHQGLLPTMLNDLRETITAEQMPAILQLLTETERPMFLQALRLASAANGPAGVAGTAVGLDGEANEPSA